MTGRERRAVARFLRVAHGAVMGDTVPAGRHQYALGFVGHELDALARDLEAPDSNVALVVETRRASLEESISTLRKGEQS